MEDAPGVRDHLFCVGIDVLRDPGWSAGGAAVSTGRDSIFDCGSGAVWMDAGSGRARAERKGMGIHSAGCVSDFVMDYGMVFWAVAVLKARIPTVLVSAHC